MIAKTFLLSEPAPPTGWKRFSANAWRNHHSAPTDRISAARPSLRPVHPAFFTVTGKDR